MKYIYNEDILRSTPYQFHSFSQSTLLRIHICIGLVPCCDTFLHSCTDSNDRSNSGLGGGCNITNINKDVA